MVAANFPPQKKLPLKVQADGICFSAAITSCEKAGLFWETGRHPKKGDVWIV